QADQAASSVTAPDAGTFGDLLDIHTTGGTTDGALTYHVTDASDACSISSGQLSIDAGTGTCAVTATMAGNGNYNPITSDAHAVTVGKADQAITFGSLPDATYGDADFTVN